MSKDPVPHNPLFRPNYRSNTVGLQGGDTQGAAGEDRAMHPKLRLGPLQHKPAPYLVRGQARALLSLRSPKSSGADISLYGGHGAIALCTRS
eukprot:CAMPEP_0172164128 /NCGR_PEP_ID=MMETSP1050-20130122/7671_1 /TAXON_ID=233186 /ORGANISM="Cryptomonas curvata, Strain CCAP979/52" /LENGTH=91 /DNA_ID=CAMNT_0012834427 /DNA_START=684 /DNA_END=959 /DNA_ORIENTATION=+